MNLSVNNIAGLWTLFKKEDMPLELKHVLSDDIGGDK